MANYNEFTELIEKTFENSEYAAMPCVPARGFVVFPNMTHTFEVIRHKTVFALKKALSGSKLLFLTAQLDIETETPGIADIYRIGTIVYVRQLVETAGGVYRCTVEGICRGALESFSNLGHGYSAKVRRLSAYEPETLEENELAAVIRETKLLYTEYISTIAKASENITDDIYNIDKADALFEMCAFNMPLTYQNDQLLLEKDTAGEKLKALLPMIAHETDINEIETRIHQEVQEAISRNQREFYIREQIAALQDELGETSNAQGDIGEAESFRAQLDAIKNIGEDSRRKILEEIDRYSKTPAYSQEAATIRSYLEIVLSLPWDNATEEQADVGNAAVILDEDHYGLKKVKDRILENIAVRALTPDVKGQIICLYGPPGVGKTSVAKSIARALGREYVRVSLGGVRDESDIRGHRKTYVGAMPGRIIQALRQVGVHNPVMLLDEIDKMSNDYRGDPSSAMLEVLDSEQNTQFRDHYTEVAFDLSDVLFITTANSLDTVQPPLLDRMEVIELNSYTREEKFNIAKKHLVPKQLKKYGIKHSQLRINDSAIYAMIDDYTREAGVRKLERAIASLCRKSAKMIVEGASKVSIKADNIKEFLGNKKNGEDFYIRKPSVGCVNGLAWTSVGGVCLPVEVVVLDGKGRIETTGSLGDVMKESAKLAVTNARRLASDYGYSPDFYDKKDIHIHAPEGATPKDGPSAGVTMTTAIVSALSGRKVRSDVAMTGEITLTGQVLQIGGLKEKAMAAYKAGIKTVIIPKSNEPDLEEFDKVVLDGLEIKTAEKIEDVLSAAFVPDKKSNTSAPVPLTAKKRGRKPSRPHTEEITPTAEAGAE